MSDPRYTDPRYSDTHLSDPVLRRDDGASAGIWGWVAGLAVVLLIAFLVVAGLNKNPTAAGNNPSATTSSAVRQVPSTTGLGSSIPRPLAPAPTKPAGTQ